MKPKQELNPKAEISKASGAGQRSQSHPYSSQSVGEPRTPQEAEGEGVAGPNISSMREAKVSKSAQNKEKLG